MDEEEPSGVSIVITKQKLQIKCHIYNVKKRIEGWGGVSGGVLV